MALNACFILALLLATVLSTHAGDPNIVTDFVVPNGVVADANFFTFRQLQGALQGAPLGVPFKVTKASVVEFPALDGQSVSYAVLQYAAGGVNGPHTHPRCAELLLVVEGWLKVGFIDSNNKIFTQILQTGDLFLFPKGMVHFQMNLDAQYPAVALSAFGSANAGAIVIPKNVFGSGIDNEVLAKSFKTDSETIQKLVAANMG